MSSATRCARGHLEDRAGGLAERRLLLDPVADWAAFLAADAGEAAYVDPRAAERTGRPAADADLIDRLEAALGRRIDRQRPGPKPGRQRTERSGERTGA